MRQLSLATWSTGKPPGDIYELGHSCHERDRIPTPWDISLFFFHSPRILVSPVRRQTRCYSARTLHYGRPYWLIVSRPNSSNYYLGHHSYSSFTRLGHRAYLVPAPLEYLNLEGEGRDYDCLLGISYQRYSLRPHISPNDLLS